MERKFWKDYNRYAINDRYKFLRPGHIVPGFPNPEPYSKRDSYPASFAGLGIRHSPCARDNEIPGDLKSPTAEQVQLRRCLSLNMGKSSK
jgi:hypothetical protein